MPYYELIVRYKDVEAYEKHGREIGNIVETKYGEMGGWDFKQLIAQPGSYPPTQYTIFEAPDDVSFDELSEVKLGEGVLAELKEI